jgi:hypothetical protein
MVQYIFVTWIQGFMSGQNAQNGFEKKPMRQIPSPEEIGFYLRGECDEHPLRSIFSVAMGYYLDRPLFK